MPNVKTARMAVLRQHNRSMLYITEHRVVHFVNDGGHEVFQSCGMASCDPIHFTGISATVFNNVKRELAENGFDLSGASGVVHGPYGIVLRYSWDEPSERLDIEILDKSFFVTCNQIRAQLDKAFLRYGSPQNLA